MTALVFSGSARRRVRAAGIRVRPRHRPPPPRAEPLEPRRLLSAGDLDRHFGHEGVVESNWHPTVAFDSGVSKLLVQPDGKIVAAGMASPSFDRPGFAEVVRYNPDGSLDTSFGSGGKVQTAEVRSISELLPTSSGGLLLVGPGSNSAAVLIRYRPDGSPDTSFDGDGLLRPDFQGPYVSTEAALQSDGKIVVAGHLDYGDRSDVYLTRLNPDGSIDTSFGDGTSTPPGFAVVDQGTFDLGAGVRVTSGDRILIGHSLSGVGDFVTRFTPSGQPDETFGDGGTILTTVFRWQDSFSAMALQGEKMILAGFAYDAQARQGYNVFARYNADGSPDTSFDGDGRLLVPYNQQVGDLRIIDAVGLATDNDGNLVVAGRAVTSVLAEGFVSAAGVRRYKPDGSPDDGFGNGGLAVVQFDGRNSGAAAVATTPDNRVIVGGWSNNLNTSPVDAAFGVARFHVNGQLDAAFGGSGSTSTRFSGKVDAQSYADAMAQQPDGKLILTGSYSVGSEVAGFGVARYNADGTIDSTFGDRGEYLGTRFTPRAVAVMNDGRILVAGVGPSSEQGRNGGYTTLLRLTPNGRPDTSFGPGGRKLAPAVYGTDSQDVPTRIALAADGKILLGGFYKAIDPLASSPVPYVMRLNADGTVDTSFGGGVVAGRFFGTVSGLFPLQGGGVLAAVDSLPTRSYLLRFRADGSPDPTFGAGGQVQVAAPLDDTQLQPDGKVVAVGTARVSLERSDVTLSRWNADGTADTAFGTGGKVVTQLLGPERLVHVRLEPGGRIVVGGDNSGYSPTAVDRALLLARFTSDGRPDTGFGTGGFVRTSTADPSVLRGLLMQSDGQVVAFYTAGQQYGMRRHQADLAPRVRRVYVSAPHWTDAFRARLGASGGSAAYRYAIPGASLIPESPWLQFNPLPWRGLSTVSIEFDRPVTVTDGDLRIASGVDDRAKQVVAFAYDPQARTATWTLAAALGGDVVRLTLDDDRVTSNGVKLDGNWSFVPADEYPSGDGTPGGDFGFTFNVLPGDANRDKRVNADDLALVRARLLTSSATRPPSSIGGYSLFCDVDGNGVINAVDLGLVRAAQLSTLPVPAVAPSALVLRPESKDPAHGLLS